jgi:hypothetical protein
VGKIDIREGVAPTLDKTLIRVNKNSIDQNDAVLNLPATTMTATQVTNLPMFVSRSLYNLGQKDLKEYHSCASQ